MPQGAIAAADKELVEFIQGFKDDPLGMVKAAYTWGEGELEKYDGPDTWQKSVLQTLGQEVRNKKDVVRIASRAGHGPGKTAVIAWIIHWFISTRPHPQIVVTANTKTQLETKTWRELAKWKRFAINGDWFEWTATRYRMIGEEDTWYASAIPWSAHNPQAFAGTHEENVLIIFDEASEVDSAIWETVEGALTSPGAIFIAFGNPSQMTGKFAELWTSPRGRRWTKFTIDTRKAKMANQGLINEWIEDYGEDSDFVRVRVKGLPPHQGANSMVSALAVSEAAMREIPDHDISPSAPLLMGVDVARSGNNENVILLRKGLRVHREIMAFNNRDLMQTASIIAKRINETRPDVVFVDAVGMGAGVVDRLIQLGHDNVVEVHAGERADDERTYYNRRTEMWHRMAVWIQHADIPDNNKLREQLLAPEVHFDAKDKMRLESKKDMQRRGVESPDYADALAMTFAHITPVKRIDDEAVETEPEFV